MIGMKYTIYLITDTVTGKHYVGRTTQKLWQRMQNHKVDPKRYQRSKFQRHVRAVLGTSYTADDFANRFSWSELQRTTSKAIAEFYEHNYIGIYNSYWDGYNSTITGARDGSASRGKKHSKETREKIKMSKTGEPMSDSARMNMSRKSHTLRKDVKTSRIIELRKQGLSMAAIGEKVGMCSSSIHRRLHEGVLCELVPE